MAKQRFYHSSQKRFKKGDTLICPSGEGSRNFNVGAGVFITTNPVPHFTIWSEVLNKKGGVWYVYEVEPIGKLYRGMWDDVICESATVVKRIGDARGIMLNHKNKRKKITYTDLDTGEIVTSDDVYLNDKCYVSTKQWKEMKKKW